MATQQIDDRVPVLLVDIRESELGRTTGGEEQHEEATSSAAAKLVVVDDIGVEMDFGAVHPFMIITRPVGNPPPRVDELSQTRH